MDIKSKNKHLPLIALVMGIFMLGLAFISFSDIMTHRKFLSKNYYFESPRFKIDLYTYFHLVKAYEINFKNFPQKPDREKLSPEQLNSLQQNLQAAARNREIEVQNRYNLQIGEAEKLGDQAKVNLLTEERNKTLQMIKEETAQKLEVVIKDAVAAKNKEYDTLKKSLLRRNGSIKYYIYDRTGKEYYSNLKNVSDIEKYIQASALFSLKLPLESNGDVYLQSVNNYFRINNWEGYFIIPKVAEGYSQFHADYKYYNSIRERVAKEGIIFVVSLFTSLLLFYYVGKNQQCLEVINKSTELIRKIPLDLRALIYLFSAIAIRAYGSNMSFFYLPLGLEHLFKLTFISLLIAYLLLAIKEAVQLSKDKAELRTQWENSLYQKYRYLIKESFINKNVMFKISASTILSMLFVLSIFFALVAIDDRIKELLLLSVIYMFFYSLTVLPYILKRLSLLNKILKGAEEIAVGNLDFVIEETGAGNLSRLAHNINNMKAGFKKSLERQMRSERLKSELITNVSHDLRTPLTSIINYVDLLKRADLTTDEVKDYVGVLDRKTQRLKVLIEDLFEASKMASGNVELNLEKVNVVSLLDQALAEYDEKIQNSPLTFKLNVANQKIRANLDGKKTWRVFENLISNVLKYSQPDTRVYLDLWEQDNKVIFTIKNVSAYELDFDPKEIFERFKRGDKSRNTEGSGLGLAIAKSIVELQGGTLNIEIDGDLFKAIVEFKKLEG